MKKIILSFAVVVLLSSCEITTVSENTMYLQKLYPSGTVYSLDNSRYIVADSIKVYDIRLRRDGSIFSKIKIK